MKFKNFLIYTLLTGLFLKYFMENFKWHAISRKSYIKI